MDAVTNETTGAVEATAPRQSVATAAESGLPITKSEAELKLEQQVKGLKLSVSREKNGRIEAEQKLQQLQQEFEAYKQTHPAQDAAIEPAATEQQEPTDEHAEIRELLQRYGLEKGYVVAGTAYFDENAALAAAGGDADSITEISPDNAQAH
ncbi:hypothetical protein [Hymenobacter metallilatus]|uniref:Uncharacterized protein n=1 Tax=Hymenobacter metallilatus TaxID=2493666 RepID=A0A3R9M1M4_9BACT|nr:hypothetical protein [Hymenobacter metallilatus]RSK33958.1 hypothetical protein EI290_09640 [Hymenobacter metallilatus]